MSKKDWRIRLDHILNSIKDIHVFMVGHDKNSFQEDIKTFRAVERCLEIIAEATKHIPEDVKTEFNQIPWRDVVDTRNIISHLYDGVDEDILWDICQNHLSKLFEVVTQIQNKYKGP